MTKKIVRAAGAGLLGLGIIWAIQVVLLAVGQVALSYAVGIALGLVWGYIWGRRFIYE